MLIDYILGQASVIVRVKLRQDTTGSKPGYGFTGLSNVSSGLNIAVIGDSEATTTAYTSTGSTIQTITTLGTYSAPSANNCRFKQVDATNHPGLYELQFSNTRFNVSGAKSITISISGVSGMMEGDATIPLRSVNPYSANNFMTGTNGQNHTYDGNNFLNTNVQDYNGNGVFSTTNGIPDINVKNYNNQVAQTDVNNLPKVNVTDWNGTVVGNLPTHFSLLSIDSSGNVTFNNASIGSVTGNIGGNIGGNINGNVNGSVGSILNVTFPANFGSLSITSAGKISEVVLVDTLTTYTSNTPQSGDAYPASIKTQSAVYDTATANESTGVITLSNGHTQTISSTGRVTS